MKVKDGAEECRRVPKSAEECLRVPKGAEECLRVPKVKYGAEGEVWCRRVPEGNRR